MDYQKAANCFAEWDRLIKKDNGVLWGHNLQVPVVLVDRKTRQAAANEPDLEGLFSLQGDVYGGILPRQVPIAATAAEFGGKLWAMVPWEMIEARLENNMFLGIMAHEAFHCLQHKLFGTIDDSKIDISHIDDDAARISFLLELNAMKRVLESESDIANSIAVAIITRNSRNKQYGKKADEDVSALVEGTAVYTELMLTSDSLQAVYDKANKYAANAMDMDMVSPFYGYALGLYYCLVLDKVCPDWKKGLSNESSLGDILAGCKLVTDKWTNQDSLPGLDEFNLALYDYDAIVESVKNRGAKRDEMYRMYQDMFSKQKVLCVSSSGKTTIAGNVFPVPNLGKVLKGNSEHIGDFGSLKVTNGLLVKNYDTGQCLFLAGEFSTEGNNIQGLDWLVELNEGFVVVDRVDYFEVVKL